MEETRECFKSRDFIEETLKNIFVMDEGARAKCQYNLFHMEENRRQFFWYSYFDNLGFVSASGEVYLVTPSVSECYEVWHIIEDFENWERAIDTTAGGECYYLTGLPKTSECSISPYALKILEEDILVFEKEE